MGDDNEKKPVTERLEDAVDEAVYKVQNAVYGEREGLNEDIPATMEDSSGFRRVNKFATRRNIARKIIKNPKLLLIGAGILAAIVIVLVIFT